MRRLGGACLPAGRFPRPQLNCIRCLFTLIRRLLKVALNASFKQVFLYPNIYLFAVKNK